MTADPERPTTDKIVVLARGLGTRMRADTGVPLDEEQQRAAVSGVKAMMPVGRPFLDHCLTAYADAGFTDACLVIGPEHQAVRDYYAELAPTRIRVSFAVQPEPHGTADALLAAERFAGGDRFVMVNGDNFYSVEALSALRAASGNAVVGYDLDALVERGNVPVERVTAFALLDTGAEGLLHDIVEKPSAEQVARRRGASLLSMNCFAFTPAIFAAARGIEPSARGELEITDAVRALVRSGTPVSVVPMHDAVLDLSSRADIASVTAALGDHEVWL